jgi:CRISPR/Cas system-associated endonuclease Cas1
LVELFRADTVDAEVLRYVRLKKKRLIEPGEKEVARFLARLNERLARPYYVASLGSCRTYRSYMLLQIEKFERAVDRGELFAPLPLPARHDTRC